MTEGGGEREEGLHPTWSPDWRVLHVPGRSALLPVPLSVSLSLSVPLPLSLPLAVPLAVPLPLSLPLSVSLPVPLPLPLSVAFSLALALRRRARHLVYVRRPNCKKKNWAEGQNKGL